MCRFDPATAETETSFVRKPTGKPRKNEDGSADVDDNDDNELRESFVLTSG